MDADIWAGGTAVRSSCVCINTRDVFPCITEPCNFAGAECKRGLSRHRTLSPPPGSSLQHTLLFSTLLSFTPVFWQQNSLSFSSSPFCLAAKSHLRCFTSMCNHGDWQIESYRITGRLCRALYYLHLKGNVRSLMFAACLFAVDQQNQQNRLFIFKDRQCSTKLRPRSVPLTVSHGTVWCCRCRASLETTVETLQRLFPLFSSFTTCVAAITGILKIEYWTWLGSQRAAAGPGPSSR